VISADLITMTRPSSDTMLQHLNDYSLVSDVLEDTPYKSIPYVVRTVGPEHLERLMQFLSKKLARTPHLEFFMQWCLELLQFHGIHLEKHRGTFMRSFRALHKSIESRMSEFKTVCEENQYNLAFVQDQAKLQL